MRPLIGREVWRIGDWGGASGHIGRRWEEVGGDLLPELLNRPGALASGFTPSAIVSLVGEREIERAVQSAGLPHSDALLLGRFDGGLALQPVDFKWTIEVARANQVSAATLQSLLASGLEELLSALRSSLADAGQHGPGEISALTLLDGLFLAPDHAANRAYRQRLSESDDPDALDPRQVVFMPVNGPEFFSVLPGWEMAPLLTAMEGARRALETLEGAEHYYRLGAGIKGAILASRRSIFAQSSPELDVIAELQAIRRARRLTTLAAVVAHLDRVMRARSELTKKLNALGRQIYPFAAFRRTLREAGVQVSGEPADEDVERSWNRLYGQLQRELTGSLVEEGRALSADGRNDVQALAELELGSARFTRRAASRAAELISAQQSVPPQAGR